MTSIHCLSGQSLPTCPYVVCSLLGDVLRTGVAPLHVINDQAQIGEMVFVGTVDQLTEYIDVESCSVIQKRRISPVVTGLVVANLPSPCVVSAEGQSAEVLGGSITLEFDVPGTYSVTIEAMHWIPAVIEVIQP